MTTSELRRAWVNFLSEQNYSYAITLKPNNTKFSVSDYCLRRNLDRFHRNLDRKLLGTNFKDEKNGVRRTRMVAVLEGLPFNGHIHAAARVNPELHVRFEAMFSRESRRPNPWTKLIPGGTAHVAPIYAADGWHEYVTKRFASINHSDNYIFLPRVN